MVKWYALDSMQNLLGMYAVVNVGCPDPSCKEQQLKGQEVHGHKEQQPTVRNCLHHDNCCN